MLIKHVAIASQETINLFDLTELDGHHTWRLEQNGRHFADISWMKTTVFRLNSPWSLFSMVQSTKKYRKVSYIRRTLVGNNIVDHSDVVGASPVGVAPTTPFLHQLYTWLQWIGQIQLQNETRNIYVFGLGASYIREWTVSIDWHQTGD